VDLPQVPALAPKMKIKAYPCVERGGVVWATWGRPTKNQHRLNWNGACWPDSHRYVTKRLQESSYLQAMRAASTPRT